MIKRLLTIYFPAAAVLTIGTLAAVFLFQSPDPELEQVEFVTTTEDVSVEQAELRQPEADPPVAEMTNDELRVDVPESAESVETYHGTSQTEEESIDRNDIRIEAIQPIVITISGPGVSVRCEVNLAAAAMAHDVMQQAADQCGFSYQTKNYSSLGVFVDALGGVTSDTSGGRYWIFYVNGTKDNVGVSSYPLQPGDTITWKFEDEY